MPFSAQTRMSGCDLNGRVIRKGAVDAIARHVASLGGSIPPEVEQAAATIAKSGGTPLAVSDGSRVLGVVHLKDIVKGGIKERFARFRTMGLRTVMITGDNPLTAAAIAAEAGVDDFLAEATPEMKLQLIRDEQAKGKLVAMTGDGTNDAPALAQADVAIAMNTGTQAAREAGNMVDLDSNPTKLLEVVEVGKQLLMTRGCLTTFSIANDVAKYFAILPAMFMAVFPEIAPLNVMRLASPQSAILSAVIFNALIIVALIPLALRGVRYRPAGGGGAPAALAARSTASAAWSLPSSASSSSTSCSPPSASSRKDSHEEGTQIVALRMTLATLVLTGLVYPLLVTGLAQVALPVAGEREPRGRRGRRVVGSELIGQAFKSPKYFQARPSAAGADGYDAANVLGVEPRPDVAEAARPRGRRRRAPEGREPAGPGPRCRPSS